MMSKWRIKIAVVALALVGAACLCTGTSPSPTLEPVQPAETSTPTQPSQTNLAQGSTAGVSGELTPDQIEAISKAAVQIVAAQLRGGRIEPLWSGSGTIVSPTGEIVTNCHVACGAPLLVILMTTSPDQPPEERFIAEVVAAREDLDLAILQVKTDMNGNPVSPTDLPYLEIGNSDELRLGDKIYLFGYPGVGGETITFTTGSVSGFEVATVDGVSRRLYIKTDAGIASGNSGGTAVDLSGRLVAIPTAVNPDVREGVTIGGIGLLMPANLIEVARTNPGTVSVAGSVALPPSDDPDVNEPNENYDQAKGPLEPGQVINGYISWEDDLDWFFITTTTTQPITISLENIPSGIDYDLYLLDSKEIVAASESETSSQEFIQFSPRAAGTYWIVVASYRGASTTQPYTLSVGYDGGSVAGEGKPSAGGIILTGRAVDGSTGRPLVGGVFGLLTTGVTCSRFFNSAKLDLSLVLVAGETDTGGNFRLVGVPPGATYSAFFIFGRQHICEDDWLDVPPDAIDSDLGDIEMSF